MKQKLLKNIQMLILLIMIISRSIKLASEADIYPRLAPTMEWDTAATHAILISVGGDLIDQKTNESLKYNKKIKIIIL